MKRPSPLIPEPIVATRRKRSLSEEERVLWQSVAKQIKPLRKKPRAHKTPAAPIEELPAAAKPVGSPKLANMQPGKTFKQDKPPPLAPLGRRERSQLSRGRKEIEARLDLHGMTLSRAHRALLSFLQRASGDGLTFVLVITGKGRAAGAGFERGVLRRQVPEWLNLPEFRNLVVGFEQAHVGHGGEGALYVRVRRGR